MTDRAWQRMLSGRRLDLLDPSPLDIEIADIAHGLARVARWNGQTTGAHPYSVAEHSLLVEQIFGIYKPRATAKERLVALLHDAAEYVIGDMISPFKAAIGLDYKSFEARLEAAVHLRFGIPAIPDEKIVKLVKRADRACAWFEATQLAGFTETEASRYFPRPRFQGAADIHLDPQPTNRVQKTFLRRFHQLQNELETE
ncbi:MAG: HD family hydrolase [Pseudomonadota bacterium]